LPPLLSIYEDFICQFVEQARQTFFLFQGEKMESLVLGLLRLWRAEVQFLISLSGLNSNLCVFHMTLSLLLKVSHQF